MTKKVGFLLAWLALIVGGQTVLAQDQKAISFEVMAGHRFEDKLDFDVAKENISTSASSVVAIQVDSDNKKRVIFKGRKKGQTEIVIQSPSGKYKRLYQAKVTPNTIEDSSVQIVFWSALVLIGIAVFFASNVIFSEEEQFQAGEKLELSEEAAVKKSPSGFILKYSRPFFKRYFSPVVASLKSKHKIRAKYKQKLANAGLTKEMTPDDFYAFKLFLVIGFPIVFLFLRWFLATEGEDPWPLKMVPVMAILGYFYPDIWLKGRIEKRQSEIILTMPFVVDMLSLSVAAGLDIMAAMTRVIDKSPKNALRDEFETLLREVRVGAARTEALRNLSWRTDVIQISSFCATLIAADSVGAQVAPILKGLSEEIRQKRSAQVEQKGAKAATKILFPMIFFIVPSVMIMIFTPIILEAIS